MSSALVPIFISNKITGMRVKVSWTASSPWMLIVYPRLHHESKYIAIVSHGTQDVSVCNVIVSEADMSGLAYKLSFDF